jgi:deferrochelatase/peroxidase EfeB
MKKPIPQHTSYVQQLPDGLREPLSNLEGNILRAHRREYAVHIFLHFKDGKQTEVKRWLKDFAVHISIAQQQLEASDQNEEGRIRAVCLEAMLGPLTCPTLGTLRS